MNMAHYMAASSVSLQKREEGFSRNLKPALMVVNVELDDEVDTWNISCVHDMLHDPAPFPFYIIMRALEKENSQWNLNSHSYSPIPSRVL